MCCVVNKASCGVEYTHTHTMHFVTASGPKVSDQICVMFFVDVQLDLYLYEQSGKKKDINNRTVRPYMDKGKTARFPLSILTFTTLKDAGNMTIFH